MALPADHAQSTGQSKGGVEGDIGWFRRNHLVPVPEVPSMKVLNEEICASDDQDLSRVIEGHRATIATEFMAEAPLLGALADEPFETARHLGARVDTKSRVCVRQWRYSVPVCFIGKRLDVTLGAEEVTISSAGTVVASHERLVHRGDESLVLDHYLEVLVRKPGALAGSTALVTARKSGAFSADHDAYWTAARRQLGDAQGTRALISALLLERTLPFGAVRAGMRAARSLCTVAPEVVAVEARRAAGEHIAPVIPIAALERYERPEPDLARYDSLLAGDQEAGR